MIFERWLYADQGGGLFSRPRALGDRHGQLRVIPRVSGWQLRPGRGRLWGMTISPNPYRGFRFPPAVIEHAVWLYHCFSLSLRDVELILAGRGIVVSYESIREWGLRFGRDLRQCAEAAPATTRRQVVQGRGVHPDPRQATLSLARGPDGRYSSAPSGLENGVRNRRSGRRGLRERG